MNKEDVIQLIEKYQAGSASAKERGLLESWYNEHARNYHKSGLPDDMWTRQDLSLQEILGSNELKVTQKKISLWPRIIGVAAAVAAIVFGIWFYNTNYKNGRHSESNPEFSSGSGSPLANDIAPGKNTATIKIGDGEAITLSDNKTGVVIGNNLRYSDGSKISGRHPEFISGSQGSRGGGPDLRQDDVVVSTPRGGTYQVTLPDGTKVWLNAASVLTYTMPLKERGGVRKVELSGEAYFEVFRNILQPFVVKSKNQEVTVLGTHFNVNAYNDESVVKTTLLEGSVNVSALSDWQGGVPKGGGGKTEVLKPGQQSILSANVIKIIEIDPIQPVAWKNGYFMFSSEPIVSIMKKISRWYDVDIDYQGKITKEGFTGSVSKYENVSEVLNTLELTGLVHFKIQGRRITVMP